MKRRAAPVPPPPRCHADAKSWVCRAAEQPGTPLVPHLPPRSGGNSGTSPRAWMPATLRRPAVATAYRGGGGTGAGIASGRFKEGRVDLDRRPTLERLILGCGEKSAECRDDPRSVGIRLRNGVLGGRSGERSPQSPKRMGGQQPARASRPKGGERGAPATEGGAGAADIKGLLGGEPTARRQGGTPSEQAHQRRARGRRAADTTKQKETGGRPHPEPRYCGAEVLRRA